MAGWFVVEEVFRHSLQRQIADQATVTLAEAGAQPQNVNVTLGLLTPWGLIRQQVGRADAQADVTWADFGRFHVTGRAEGVQLHDDQSLDLTALRVQFALPATNFATLFRAVLSQQQLFQDVSLEDLAVVANPAAGTATVTAGSWAGVELRPQVTDGQLSFRPVSLTLLGVAVDLTTTDFTVPVDLAGQLPEGLTIEDCSVQGDDIVVTLAGGPMTVR